MANLNNSKIFLVVLILSAIFLRITGNMIREEVFFHKPFLFFGDGNFSVDPDPYFNSMSSDSKWYDGTARAFLNGKGIASFHLGRWWTGKKFTERMEFLDNQPWLDFKKIDESYIAHRAVSPLYPLFLALCYYFGGENTISFFIPQVILGSLTCVLIYLLAKEIFNNERVSRLAGLAVAFYPELIFWTYRVRTETLFIFLLALGFWLLIKGNLGSNRFLIFISSIIFGLVSLTRITFIPFIPFLFLWQLFFFKKDKKKGVMVSITMILIITLVLLPWSMRNYLVFNKFTPFTSDAYAFLFQNGADKIEKAEHFYNSHNSLPHTIVRFIMHNPQRFIVSSIKCFITFWGPFTMSMEKIAKVYKGLSWLIIFPFAFWGIIAARKTWGKSGLIIIFIFYHSLFHATSFMDSGLVYRYPILPFLCIFAAYGFWEVHNKLNNKDKLVS